jgi:hypothetical protein
MNGTPEPVHSEGVNPRLQALHAKYALSGAMEAFALREATVPLPQRGKYFVMLRLRWVCIPDFIRPQSVSLRIFR